ncbi:1-phosphatidylinositol-3-phosphate 5-kinase FAB1B-like protein [Tanacetum coccineum]
MLYGFECWPIAKALANRVEVTELRMVRWTYGKTMLDMIPDEVYRAELEVENIINKIREGRLRWENRVKHDIKELLMSKYMTSDRNEWKTRIRLGGSMVGLEMFACLPFCSSIVMRGVVCKKNVTHRRMTSRIEKPRFLLLGRALEYQHEMDHLKMVVAKIDAHQPDVLLVEKSFSQYAQEYLLVKDISLVLNIKRPLLKRIAWCTGAQILPSIDHLSAQKLGIRILWYVSCSKVPKRAWNCWTSWQEAGEDTYVL